MKNSDPAAVQKETVELINYVDGVGQINCLDSSVLSQCSEEQLSFQRIGLGTFIK